MKTSFHSAIADADGVTSRDIEDEFLAAELLLKNAGLDSAVSCWAMP